MNFFLTSPLLLLLLSFFFPTPTISSALTSTPCRSSCGTIPINYPFGIDDGCGAPQFRHMLNCSSSSNGDLFFITPSGAYKVQHIDYPKKTLLIYDPSMSTCSILQPHHDFLMTDIQSAVIPPTSDTVFALLNCSVDSPVLNHYKNLCFDFSSHSCDELYSSCNAFRVFRLLNNNNNNNNGTALGTSANNSGSSLTSPSSSPPCCFTGYDTVKYMSMNILDCSHYTTVVNTDELSGIGPLDWVYGIKLSYSFPETGCDRCSLSGGTCGFDTETEGMLCLCSVSTNSTRQCGAGSITAAGVRRSGHSLLTSWMLGFTLAAAVFMLLRTPPCS